MEYALVAAWLVTYAAFAALGLPIAARIFRRVPGRGAGFALPVSLVVVTLTAYWVGHVAFGWPALAAGLVVLAVASAAAGLDRDALRERRVELASDLDLDRNAVLEVAVVFTVAFLFLVAVRAVDPAVHPLAGEKFLDFGLLKSLLRSPVLPPEDIWFANEPVQYYYGGHLVASLLIMFTGTPPAFAYNLALAGFYAMLVAGVYDLAGAIRAAQGGSRRLAGALSAFFVGFASNLATAGRFFLLVLPLPYREQAARAIAEHTPHYTTKQILAGAEGFHYWPASRIIPGTINEFPLFAWLNGDMHAHMMGMPFLVLAAALAYSYYRTPESERRRRLALVFVGFPLLGGLQVVVDTWSFPSVFGVLALALAFAPAHPRSLLPGPLGRDPSGDATAAPVANGNGRESTSDVAPTAASTTTDVLDGVGDRLLLELDRAGTALVLAGGALVGAVVVGLPFLLGAASGREIAILAPGERSLLGPLLIVHGAFVLGFGAYLLQRLDVRRPELVLLAVAATAYVAVAGQMAVVAFAVPLLVLAWFALRFDSPVGYESVLVVAGAGLVTLVEFVYVKELAGPLRMNTVFKTYMQVWVLWGTAMGVALAGLVRGSGSLLAWVPDALARFKPTPSTRRAVASVFVVALVLSTSVYGAFALSGHFAGSPAPTLDATRFVEQRHPDEAPAIAWLDAREGQPTLLSAPATSFYPGPGASYPVEPGMYSWDSSPAASLTGVPTVAGWHHEVGYRGQEPYLDRVLDVDRAYTGSATEAAHVLRKYDVEYVWVGPAERARYQDITIDEVPGLTVAVQTESVTVYRVNHDQLPGGPGDATESAG